MKPPARACIIPLAVAAALTVLGAGCAGSGSQRPPVELDVAEIADVRELLSERAALTALEELDRLERSSAADAGEIEELRDLAIAQVQADFAAALSDGKLERCLSLAASLAALGVEATGADGRSWSQSEILREAARHSGERGLSVLAAYYGFRLASLVGAAGADEEDRESFLLTLERLRDPAAMHYALGLLADAGLSRAGGAGAGLPWPVPLSEPIKGTVTVLVDRGLRIQGGVGYPDRMLGSGFFVDPSGYILTNHHVISSEVDPKYEGYSRLYVSRPDHPNERIPAKVVGYDQILDLALIKVEVGAEYVFYPALESEVRPGEQIYAIGSPVSQTLESTVNSGIVSAVGRRLLQLGDTMQIDVPVNPGNSGGPLLDADRRLVGVVFAGLQQFEGINFAIPSGWIRRVFPRLFQGGAVTYGWLAASVAETEVGLEVVYTLPGGPAAKAGIHDGDILEKIDGVSVTGIADAQGRLMELEPPQLVRVEWRSGGDLRQALVALAERPLSPIETALERDTRDQVIFPLFGMKLEKVGQSFGKGRYVVRRVLAGSQAAEIGLSANDPLSIEGWRIDKEHKLAVLNMYVKEKNSGYLEGIVQLYAYLEQDSFI